MNTAMLLNLALQALIAWNTAPDEDREQMRAFAKKVLRWVDDFSEKVDTDIAEMKRQVEEQSRARARQPIEPRPAIGAAPRPPS